MLITFFRAIVLYIIVLIVMRLMGKREIGQLQPFELAISIMIADLATLPMAETGIPISNGIIPILGLLVMHLVISLLNMKSTKAREIICGKPSILIFRGKIDQHVLKKERFTINELEERLRDNNIFNIGDVEYAVLETSGQVTVIPKPNKRPTVPEDFNIEPQYEGIPYDLVVDGKVMYKNFNDHGTEENCEAWFQTVLNAFKEADLSEYAEFVALLMHWKKEILNSFQRPFDDRKLSNALSENINGQIKTYLAISNGVTNFTRFRKRCLLSLNKKTFYSINNCLKSDKYANDKN